MNDIVEQFCKAFGVPVSVFEQMDDEANNEVMKKRLKEAREAAVIMNNHLYEKYLIKDNEEVK